MHAEEIDQERSFSLSPGDIEKLRGPLEVLFGSMKSTPPIVDKILYQPLSGGSCVLSHEEHLDLAKISQERKSWVIEGQRLLVKDIAVASESLEDTVDMLEAFDIVMSGILFAVARHAEETINPKPALLKKS